MPFAQAFCEAFDSWWSTPEATDFPYEASVRALREAGKHFVHASVTDRLSLVRDHRDRVAGETDDQKFLDGFLDTALDKTEHRYDYGTYCALQMLNLSGVSRPAATCAEIEQERDTLLIMLIGDLLSFEGRTLEAGQSFLPLMRPGDDLAKKRLRLGLAAIRPSLKRLTLPDTVVDIDDLLQGLRGEMSDVEDLRLKLSLLPVHTVHDEYMFLRVLQASEVNFSTVAALLRGAIDRMPDDAADALARLQKARGIMQEAARLFPLISTIQPDAFANFRRFTEGASAIQSAGYKTVESLCRRPDEARLQSVAYKSVPAVQKAVADGQPTFDDAFAAADESGMLSLSERDALQREMDAFSKQILRWRQAHYRLAQRILGDRIGTGYTEGVPYLKQVRDIPVFETAVSDAQ